MEARVRDFPENQSHPDHWLNLLFLLVFCTLAALLGRDLYASYHQELKFSRQHSSNLAALIAQQVTTSTEKINVVLTEAAHAFTPYLTQREAITVRQANRELLRREQSIPETQINSLRVIDADGQVVFSAGDSDEIPAVNVGDRQYFQKQKNNPDAGLVLSEPLLSRFTGKWLFTLSQRINHPDGSFAGLVQTAIRAEHFEAMLAKINIGNNGNLSLFSLAAGDTRLMARQPALPEQVGKPFKLMEVEAGLERGISDGDYRARSRVDQVDREYVYRRIHDLPLLVTVGEAHDAIMEGWWQKAALYGTSLLLITLELVWLLSRQRGAARAAQAVLEEKVKARTQELSQANANLEHAREMAEAANSAKNRFLSNMSHELRTPLNGILGIAQLMEMGGMEEHERQESAVLLSASGKRLLDIFDSIMEFTRLESGTSLERRDTPFCPEDILNHAARIFDGMATQKGLRIICDSDEPSQKTYASNPGLLERMLISLVDNAISFTDQGSIILSVGECGQRDNSVILEFSVTDTGIGIAASDRRRIFQAFSQLDTHLTRAHEGIGLSLALLKRQSEAMGGSCGMESEPGAGSRFWFRIPVDRLD